MIKKIMSKFKRYWYLYIAPRVLLKYRVITAIYYVFLPRFGREERAVLAGITTNNINSRQFVLIRNIHRLEKGLSMKNRRDVFGINYISETVQLFKEAAESNHTEHTLLSREQFYWAYDVLKKFFSVVGEHELLLCQSQIFKSIELVSSHTKCQSPRLPYKRKTGVNSDISYEQLLQLAKQRRSTRWYLQELVDRKLIDKAFEISKLSPSDCNRSPIRFIVVDDPILVKKYAEIPLGTKGFAHNIPMLIICIGMLDAYIDERDRHSIYINTGLQGMSLMYAFETLGLASCPLNWPDIEERERMLEDYLSLAPYERVTMLLAVGYPDPEGYIPYSAKQEVIDFRIFI